VTAALLHPTPTAASHRRRLGFLGVGWIGRHRMEAILATGAAEATVICEPSPEMMQAARALAPDAWEAASLDELLDRDLDGLVIATPSALHAEQSIAALERGVAVFCQKPLGRSPREVAAVIDAARKADRLIGVDLSYRHAEPMRVIHERLHDRAIGEVFAADLVFHNAYGPDKPWFYDTRQSGGGCVMDLGVHLVDLLLWNLDFPAVEMVSSHLFANGRPLERQAAEVEDYAVATLRLDGGAVARIACSWRLHAGQDADISATFHGTQGSLRFANVSGSFYDFTAELFRGTRRELLAGPPDDWGGRAAAAWAVKLAKDGSFDVSCEALLASAEVVDRIYQR
jgi:predicted dehydrogenase